MEITKDISIGENRWIKWVDFDSNDNDLLEIDEFLNSTWKFWKLLETQCVSECCGIDAFSFWFEDLKSASKDFNISNLLIELNVLKSQIESKNHNVLISEKLNTLVEKSVFVKLVSYIIESLHKLNK